MQNYLTTVFFILIVLNITAFILVGVDKKRSIQNSERVPEVYLFFTAIFFSSLGVLMGMYFFHHKTKKIYFPLGIGILLIEQAGLFYFLVNNFLK